jgi:uncharacterized membrane protein
MNYTDLLLRWLHVFSAIAMVGGTIFWRFVLFPSLQSIPEDRRADLLSTIRGRWARIVMIGSAVLLVSGLINAVLAIQRYAFSGPAYHIMVSVKLLLALVVFWLAATLSGRSQNAERFRKRMGYWLTVNLVLAVILVGLAGIMKLTPRQPKSEATTTLSVERMPRTGFFQYGG